MTHRTYIPPGGYDRDPYCIIMDLVAEFGSPFEAIAFLAQDLICRLERTDDGLTAAEAEAQWEREQPRLQALSRWASGQHERAAHVQARDDRGHERMLLELARRVGIVQAVALLAGSVAETLAIGDAPDADVDAARAIELEYERLRAAE